jgi:hypothetical protein
MARSKATTVQQYLDELPPDRRETIATVRTLVKKNLPKGYEETMRWGMISYEIPLARLSVTYNRQPLSYAALAAQKNYNTLYLMAAGFSPFDLKAGFRKAGKKLDMGKACVHFKTIDDLPLPVIAESIASLPVDAYIDQYEKSRRKK